MKDTSVVSRLNVVHVQRLLYTRGVQKVGIPMGPLGPMGIPLEWE